MCGRYTLTNVKNFVTLHPWIADLSDPDAPAHRPRYNIAPTQPIAAVLNRPDPRGKYPLRFLYWGLVPAWAKDQKIGGRMVNLRAETLTTRPAFRRLLSRRRCLVPADGFYEWQKIGDRKRPLWIHLADLRPLALAGVWDDWGDDAGNELTSCALITCAPNDLMKPIHNRMPAIVPPEGYLDWLDPAEKRAEEVAQWLRPYAGGDLEALPVSTRVNNARQDGAECIAPIEGGGQCEVPVSKPRGKAEPRNLFTIENEDE